MNELRTVDAAIASARPKGLPAGAMAPPISGELLGGGRFDPESVTGRRYVVAFVAPDCAPCRPLIHDLADADAVRDLPPTVMVTRPPDRTDHEPWLALQHRDDVAVVLQDGDELADRFQTHTTPHVFVVDSDGVILAQGVANDARAIRELAGNAVTVR
jgi:hypothetical protein